MKQIIQHLNNGIPNLEEVPAPAVRDGHLLIRSSCSLVSAGTERMLLSFGKAGWIGKALQQPERVRMVADKIRSDGLGPTLQAVRHKINRPVPLGYSNAGVVLAVGKGVDGYRIGDRVVSNGPHAEFVCVPRNLVTLIPPAVADEEACFTVVAAIALQGIRLAAPSFGETVVVTGLGLIGQIAVQLLLANGCRVIGIDTDTARCMQAAEKYGITSIRSGDHSDTVAAVMAHTAGKGADAVLIAAATRSDSVISEAAGMSRKRGRIILVGVTGLQLRRSDFYEKELQFQVSCSYGPGRYDYSYEQQGQDYPAAFVRWTAQRNFEAILQAIASGQLNVRHLSGSRYSLEQYTEVYEQLEHSSATAHIFVYDNTAVPDTTLRIGKNQSCQAAPATFGIIGAGSFCAGVLLPALKKGKAFIRAISSEHGLSAAQLARQYAIGKVSTDNAELLQDNSIDTIMIATRHDTHTALCIAALEAGKHVFIEKPLAIDREQLRQVAETAARYPGQMLHVGFNRRFSPLALKMQQLIGKNPGPLNIVITVNAGPVPANHWLSDALTSGGRIIGEACHFIDLASFLCDDLIQAVCTNTLQDDADQASILLRYTGGSQAAIHYFTNGSKAYDKERVEVYSQGRTLVLENWKKLSGYGFKGFSGITAAQDKGHQSQFLHFQERIRAGGVPLIPLTGILNTTEAAIAATESSRNNSWIGLNTLITN